MQKYARGEVAEEQVSLVHIYVPVLRRLGRCKVSECYVGYYMTCRMGCLNNNKKINYRIHQPRDEFIKPN